MRWYWLAGLGLLACGCGLADYEQRMISSQVRQQHFEEENRLLDSDLRKPYKADKSGQKYPVAAVALRPPRGINTEPFNEKEPRGDLLYSYRPRQEKSGSPFALVELAFANASQKDFTAEVLKNFTFLGKPAIQQRKLHAAGRLAHTFETIEFADDQFFYSVNIWHGPSKQVAIVYWITPPAQKDSCRRVIQMSLESFAGDGETVDRTGPADSVPRPPPVPD